MLEDAGLLPKNDEVPAGSGCEVRLGGLRGGV